MTLLKHINTCRLHALPALITHQHTVADSVSHQQWIPTISNAGLNSICRRTEPSNSNTSARTFAHRIIHLPSSLERFGLSQHKVLRTLRNETAAPRSKGREEEKILHEEYVYSWASNRFGFGIRLSRNFPYGSILPSLTTYPIVPFNVNVIKLILSGSVSEVQQAFSTGILHPYSRNQHGETLLHVGL